MAADSDGNAYLTGTFANTLDLGGEIVKGESPRANILVAKFDHSGQIVWARSIPGATMDDQGDGHIAVDAHGNVGVCGEFYQSLVVGDLPAVPAIKGPNLFVAKFDRQGRPVWARRCGEGLSGSGPYRIAYAPNGDMIVTGGFTWVVEFGGGTLHSRGARDIFLARLDSLGRHVFSRRFGGLDSQEAEGLAVGENGEIAISGWSLGEVSFGGETFVPDPENSNSFSFLALFSPTGEHRWSRRIAPARGSIFATRVALAGADAFVISGSFIGTLALGEEPLMAPVYGNVYTAAIDHSGSFLWSRRNGGKLGVSLDAIAGDGCGDVAVALVAGVGPFDMGGLVLPGNFGTVFGDVDSDGGGGRWGHRILEENIHSASVAVGRGREVVFGGIFTRSVDVGDGLVGDGMRHSQVLLGEYLR